MCINTVTEAACLQQIHMIIGLQFLPSTDKIINGNTTTWATITRSAPQREELAHLSQSFTGTILNNHTHIKVYWLTQLNTAWSAIEETIIWFHGTQAEHLSLYAMLRVLLKKFFPNILSILISQASSDNLICRFYFSFLQRWH